MHEESSDDQIQDNEDLGALSQEAKILKDQQDKKQQNASSRMSERMQKLDGEVLSIHKIVESYPAQFKVMVDRLVQFADEQEVIDIQMTSSRRQQQKKSAGNRSARDESKNQALDEQDQRVLKTVFLYFFELMGLDLQGSKGKDQKSEPVEIAKELLELSISEINNEKQRQKTLSSVDKLFKD